MHGRAELENAGSAAWQPRGDGQVSVSYHWLDPLGNAIVWGGIFSPVREARAAGRTGGAVVRHQGAAPAGPLPPFARRRGRGPQLVLRSRQRPARARRRSGAKDRAAGAGRRPPDRRRRAVQADPGGARRHRRSLSCEGEEAEASPTSSPAVVPAPDWSRRCSTRTAEGFACIGGSIEPPGAGCARRKAAAQFAPWAPEGGRSPASPNRCSALAPGRASCPTGARSRAPRPRRPARSLDLRRQNPHPGELPREAGPADHPPLPGLRWRGRARRVRRRDRARNAPLPFLRRELSGRPRDAADASDRLPGIAAKKREIAGWVEKAKGEDWYEPEEEVDTNLPSCAASSAGTIPSGPRTSTPFRGSSNAGCGPASQSSRSARRRAGHPSICPARGAEYVGHRRPRRRQDRDRPRRVLRRARRPLRARPGRRRASSLRRGAFDLTFCVATLHHALDLPKMVAEMARVTKRGGAVVALNEGTRPLGWSDEAPAQEGEKALGINEHTHTAWAYLGAFSRARILVKELYRPTARCWGRRAVERARDAPRAHLPRQAAGLRGDQPGRRENLRRSNECR